MDNLMTTKQVAAALGLSTRTVKAMVASGKIPSVKIGGARRFRPADVAALTGAPVENSQPVR